MRGGFGTGSTRMTEYLALNIETERSDNTDSRVTYVAECHEAEHAAQEIGGLFATLIAALSENL